MTKTARLRVLELPAEHLGEAMTTPFVLVLDRATDSLLEALLTPGVAPSLKDASGARGVLFFSEEIDLD